MSRRNIIIIVAFIAIIIVMMVAGNVIIVAEKLATAAHFPPLEYIIYGVLAALFLYIFITPIARIHMTPELPRLSVKPGENMTALRALAQSLAKTMDYIPDKAVRNSHTEKYRRRVAMAGSNTATLAATIEEEIANRFAGNEEQDVKGIDKRITDWAASSFMITAVSQNGKFDTISSIYINIRMISDLVRAAGFRPTRRQLFRLYTTVLLTSLMTFMLSDALDDTPDVSPFANLGEDDADNAVADAATDDDSALSPYAILKGIKIPGFVLGSALDGAANALMTLRIGYITSSYLREGAAAFRGTAAKRAIKHRAMRQAVAGLPAVIAAGSSVIGKTASSALLKIFKTRAS